VSRFQYKLAAVCILSAASVQTSIWICVIKRGLVLTDNMKYMSQHCMLCLSFYVSLQYADVHVSCQGVKSLCSPRYHYSGLLVTFLYYRSAANQQEQQEQQGANGCRFRQSAVKFLTLLFYRFVR